ncbi:hypothetical protein QE152_g39842 [Popillia japonica]|uniref:Retrotransposon Copia-like N-terminal domain-containing protein n=1 Tax=Popillia japonica TaxID=7064 RepID=A0AAW1HSZ6_POPJA
MSQAQIVSALKSNGNNWTIWKFQTTVILKGRGLLEVITEAQPDPADKEAMKSWKQNDASAQELIVIRMEEGPMVHLLCCTSEKDIWSKLKAVYDIESATAEILLSEFWK